MKIQETVIEKYCRGCGLLIDLDEQLCQECMVKASTNS